LSGSNLAQFNLIILLLILLLCDFPLFKFNILFVLFYIIREIARMLANDYKKRVMIVDTSNEIGGDGDIPHAGIGSARRMQVPNSDMQHKVLVAFISCLLFV
jgi:hypothetical protein